MREVYASDQALFQVGLERGTGEHENDRTAVAELLSAVDALTQGWLHPFGVGFQLVYADPNEHFEEVGRPPAPHHFLREAKIPEHVLVREAFSNSGPGTVSDSWYAISVLAFVGRRRAGQGLPNPCRNPRLGPDDARRWLVLWSALKPTSS